MADTTSYVITIKLDGNGGASSAKKSTANTVSGGKVREKESDFVKTVKDLHGIVKMAPVGYALSFSKRVVNTYNNTVELRTGNARLQERNAYNFNTISTIASIGGAFTYSAVTGNALGMGASMIALASKAYDIAESQYMINLNRSLEQVTIQQANIRAGAMSSRTGQK